MGRACVAIQRTCQDHPAGHRTRREKERQTGRGGKTISKSGQAWPSPTRSELQRTETDGGGSSGSHQWCLNNPTPGIRRSDRIGSHVTISELNRRNLCVLDFKFSYPASFGQFFLISSRHFISKIYQIQIPIHTVLAKFSHCGK